MKKTAVRQPRSRDAAKQETREALLQAAMELFRSEGLDASLDAVCARAGYTRGAFYVHFRDREELISAVIERVGFTLIDTLLGTENNDEDFLVLVQRFLHTVAAGHYPISREGGLRLLPHGPRRCIAGLIISGCGGVHLGGCREVYARGVTLAQLGADV